MCGVLMCSRCWHVWYNKICGDCVARWMDITAAVQQVEHVVEQLDCSLLDPRRLFFIVEAHLLFRVAPRCPWLWRVTAWLLCMVTNQCNSDTLHKTFMNVWLTWMDNVMHAWVLLYLLGTEFRLSIYRTLQRPTYININGYNLNAINLSAQLNITW